MALNQHLATGADRGNQRIGIAHALHQRRGAAVDEALRQTLMQGVREIVLDGARAFLPMARIRQPLGVMLDVGPSADVADAGGERIDIAVAAVEAGDALGDPRLRQRARLRQMEENLPHQPDMAIGQGLA